MLLLSTPLLVSAGRFFFFGDESSAETAQLLSPAMSSSGQERARDIDITDGRTISFAATCPYRCRSCRRSYTRRSYTFLSHASALRATACVLSETYCRSSRQQRTFFSCVSSSRQLHANVCRLDDVRSAPVVRLIPFRAPWGVRRS